MNETKVKKNNDYWKVSAAKFQGYMKRAVDTNTTDLTQLKEDMIAVKIYIGARKAVQNLRSAIWGFIGSLFFLTLGFALYKIFG